MTRICLECATPKFPMTDKCGVCDTKTHTIEGTARRPICHDCVFYKIKCRDGEYRSYLDYGSRYLSEAVCRGGAGEFGDGAIRKVAPAIATRLDECGGYQRHEWSKMDGRPNPLTVQQRKEIRDYLECPSAFWLDPDRWNHVKNVRNQAFWAPPESRAKVALKVGAGLGLGLVGLLLSGKVDKKPPESIENS